MFGRGKKKKGGALPSPEEITERLPDREDLVQRMEALVDALGTTRDRAQELAAQAGWRRGRRRRASRQRALEAARSAAEQARHAAELLPGRDEMLELTRRTGDRLWPERAAARRSRARRRRLGLGLAVTALAGGAAALAARQFRGQRQVGPPIDMQPDVNGPVRPVDLDRRRERAAGDRPASPQPD